MSHKTYNKIWHEAQTHIEEATRNDLIIQQSDQPDIDKSKGRALVVELYVKYLLSVNKLVNVYDQIVQPQKLILIKRVLIACFGRLIELKYDLAKLDDTDFTYVNDHIQMQYRVTVMDLEITIPKFFQQQRDGLMDGWYEQIDKILFEHGFLTESDERRPLTEAEAILVIQSHERARQGRVRHQFMKEIKSLFRDTEHISRALQGKTKQEPQPASGSLSILSAIRIQKIWRGYIERREVRKKKVEEMLLIGMLPPLKVETAARQRLDEIHQQRRLMQVDYANDYQQECEDMKRVIKKKREKIMIEDMRDEIRSWLIDYKEHTGKLPDFPSDERGGSRLMFNRSGFSSHGGSSEVSKSTSKDSKERKSKGSKGKDSGTSKSKDEVEKEEFDSKKYFRMIPSNFLADIITSCDEFAEKWKTRDESHNPNEQPYKDLITSEKTCEVENETRKIVDGQMREELKTLQAALDRDRAGKGKRSKKEKKGRRGGKKSKKKREKDLTPDRTLESLFEELVLNGIIRKYPKRLLSSFIGERSLFAKKYGTLGDLRQIMTEYCVIPMASEHIHENAPYMKSLLIAGPESTGKKTLVYSICTELDAVLFDISASNLVGKYPGKSGLAMLMHLVYKVGKLLQPSIIFVDDCEKTFMKKVPKTDKTDPKRLKKDLPKLVKSFSKEDRVMLIGTTPRPWDCDQKLLAQTYHHYILMPPPTHGDIVLAWKYYISQHKTLRHFDISSLARLANGYALGRVLESAREVLSSRRVVQLRTKPLQPIELISALSRRDPIWRDHELALLEWFQKR